MSKLTDKFITALFDDWAAIPCPSIRLPNRYGKRLPDGKLYWGGLLFGQLLPRFENRLIASCPVTFENTYQETLAKTGDIRLAKKAAEKTAKVPSRKCVEFKRYRWAMMVANVQISTRQAKNTRPLSISERQTLNNIMQTRGFLTPSDLKAEVLKLTGGSPNNLDQLLLHPDSGEALVLDAVKKELAPKLKAELWALLPAHIQKRAIGQLRRGKLLSMSDLFKTADSETLAKLNVWRDHLSETKSRKNKEAEIASIELSIGKQNGRAPYTRAVMEEVCKDVLERGIHPAEKGGVLYRSEALRQSQMQRNLDEQTNNHLIRHRLRILERLHHDILKEYAGGLPERVARITIEVNRDLREMSGLTRKELEMDMGRRLASFKTATKKLEQDFADKKVKLTPGLIRKARIAEDLGWTCPYTGKKYDALDLLYRKVDKDHIIPRSDRASDSLDSLVITFTEVNKMKGKRTALQFVEEFQSQPIIGIPHLAIRTLRDYKGWVDGLDTRKGHEDDQHRKKHRKELLLLKDYVEKEFVPRDLTQTSQLVRLGAQNLERQYLGQKQPPAIISLPGSVTGAVRKGWSLLGCLSAAAPDILDETGTPLTKTEIRDITHLHHALDACVLALASRCFPRDGGIWELLVKRHLTPPERALLKSRLGELCAISAEGQFNLKPLPDNVRDQIRQRLAERRVVQHIPADMTGLAAEETVWRVYDPTDPHPSAQRLRRWFNERIKAGELDGIPEASADSVLIVSRKRQPETGTASGKTLHQTTNWRWVYQEIDKSKLVGFTPKQGSVGRLKKLKAVKILGDNYGLALDPKPQIIRFHKVWPQLAEIRSQNGGKPVRVLRNGQLIQIPTGSRAGIWKILSTKDTEAYGLAVDLARPDRLCLDKGNAPIERILAEGMRQLPCSYTGTDASSVNYTPQRSRKRVTK